MGKRHKPEKLRQVEVMTGQGTSMADAIRSIGVTEVTYYLYGRLCRWQADFGLIHSRPVANIYPAGVTQWCRGAQMGKPQLFFPNFRDHHDHLRGHFCQVLDGGLRLVRRSMMTACRQSTRMAFAAFGACLSDFRRAGLVLLETPFRRQSARTSQRC